MHSFLPDAPACIITIPGSQRRSSSVCKHGGSFPRPSVSRPSKARAAARCIGLAASRLRQHPLTASYHEQCGGTSEYQRRRHNSVWRSSDCSKFPGKLPPNLPRCRHFRSSRRCCRMGRSPFTDARAKAMSVMFFQNLAHPSRICLRPSSSVSSLIHNS